MLSVASRFDEATVHAELAGIESLQNEILALSHSNPGLAREKLVEALRRSEAILRWVEKMEPEEVGVILQRIRLAHGTSIRLRGVVLLADDQPARALPHLHEALLSGERWELPNLISDACANLGGAYLILTDHAQALRHFQRALTLQISCKDLDGQARTLGNLGTLYGNRGSIAESNDFHLRSLEIQRASDDRIGASKSHANLAGNFDRMGDLVQAIAHMAEAISLVRDQKMPALLSDMLASYGHYFAKSGQWAEAADCFTEYERLLEANRGGWTSLPGHLRWGRFLTQCPQPWRSTARGILILEHVLAAANEHQRPDIEEQAHVLLSEIHEKEGRADQALYHLRKAHALLAAYTRREAQTQFERLRVAYELEAARKEADRATHERNTLAALNRALEDHRDDLAETNARLQAVIREKNDFLQLVVHDLKNPLNAIRALAQFILTESCDDPDATRDLSAQIHDTSDRMFELIQKLLDLNAIEIGSQSLQPDNLDLIELVETTTAAHEMAARAKQIQLSIQSEAEALPARLNAFGITQALDNLVSNALKFSPPGKSVSVRVLHDATTYRIEVADEGPGITPEDKKKLFTKYGRLSNRPTAAESSHGLGLFIVKRLTDMMGGRIECESTVGQGTTFRCILPVEPTPATEAGSGIATSPR